MNKQRSTERAEGGSKNRKVEPDNEEGPRVQVRRRRGRNAGEAGDAAAERARRPGEGRGRNITTYELPTEWEKLPSRPSAQAWRTRARSSRVERALQPQNNREGGRGKNTRQATRAKVTKEPG